jgi:hypothetical protein
MPEDFRKLKRKIEKAGYFLEMTKNNHYKIKTDSGDVLVRFAVSHGRHTKGGGVWDSYVNLIMKAIKTQTR